MRAAGLAWAALAAGGVALAAGGWLASQDSGPADEPAPMSATLSGAATSAAVPGSSLPVAGPGSSAAGIGAAPLLGSASPSLADAPPPPLLRAPASTLPQQFDEVPYDGRFTFLRVYFESGGGGMRGFGGGRGSRGEPPWAHDYPRAETNFAKILAETTMMTPFMGGSRVLAMDDPEIFKYPVIYMVEVGYWRPSDAEVQALGDYLRKGGFLIVDDFRDRQIYSFLDVLQRALPGIQPREMPTDHGIFDAFFRIEDPYALIPPYGRSQPLYLGLFEDNDVGGRLMAILNYNNDIAEYWEFSDRGYYPIDLNNDAFKFGVNYIVYAMTH